MADEGMTVTGLTELRSAVEQLPAALTAKLRLIAMFTASRIKDGAQQRLIAQQKTLSRKLAGAITVGQPDEANKQVVVTSSPPSGQPGNVTLWNEHGTIRMEARPYMRPAAQAEDRQYHTDIEQAVAELGTQTFKS